VKILSEIRCLMYRCRPDTKKELMKDVIAQCRRLRSEAKLVTTLWSRDRDSVRLRSDASQLLALFSL
jgi:hypothetical protein